MLIFLAALIGAILGGMTARRHHGRIADILLFATVFALIFGLAGLVAMLVITRSFG